MAVSPSILPFVVDMLPSDLPDVFVILPFFVEAERFSSDVILISLLFFEPVSWPGSFSFFSSAFCILLCDW
jgi:hypothetical protein